jgi:hypothetical protein
MRSSEKWPRVSGKLRLGSVIGSLHNKHGYAGSEHCHCRDRHDDRRTGSFTQFGGNPVKALGQRNFPFLVAYAIERERIVISRPTTVCSNGQKCFESS